MIEQRLDPRLTKRKWAEEFQEPWSLTSRLEPRIYRGRGPITARERLEARAQQPHWAMGCCPSRTARHAPGTRAHVSPWHAAFGQRAATHWILRSARRMHLAVGESGVEPGSSIRAWCGAHKGNFNSLAKHFRGRKT